VTNLARDIAIDAAIVNGMWEVARLEGFRASLTRHRLVGNICEERYSVAMRRIGGRIAYLQLLQSGSNADASTMESPR